MDNNYVVIVYLCLLVEPAIFPWKDDGIRNVNTGDLLPLLELQNGPKFAVKAGLSCTFLVPSGVHMRHIKVIIQSYFRFSVALINRKFANYHVTRLDRRPFHTLGFK